MNGQFRGDARLLLLLRLLGFRLAQRHGLLGGDARLVLRALSLSLLLRRGRAGFSRLVDDVALLRKLRFLLLAVDLKRLLSRLQILLRDGDLSVADRQVPLLALGFRDLGEGSQAFSVERIVRVEVLGVGLVELGERSAFQFKAVELKFARHGLLDTLDEIGALFLQIGQHHGGSDRAQGIDELRFHEFTQLIGFVGAIAQGLRGKRNGLLIGLNTHIELDTDIDAHTILGDHRFGILAPHVEAQCLQIDPADRLEHRQDDRTAIEHHLLPAEASPNVGAILFGSGIQTRDHQTDRQDSDQTDHRRQGNSSHQIKHLSSLPMSRGS